MVQPAALRPISNVDPNTQVIHRREHHACRLYSRFVFVCVFQRVVSKRKADWISIREARDNICGKFDAGRACLRQKEVQRMGVSFVASLCDVGTRVQRRKTTLLMQDDTRTVVADMTARPWLPSVLRSGTPRAFSERSALSSRRRKLVRQRKLPTANRPDSPASVFARCGANHRHCSTYTTSRTIRVLCHVPEAVTCCVALSLSGSLPRWPGRRC